ncbi:MAG: EAL domain-containing protein, partial [Gammaproteobacteria bacterium]|nr:EAL domain-containing protein [Gammaproteobacteria bacterium]
ESLKGLNISQINNLDQDESLEEMDLALQQMRNHYFVKHRLASGQVRDVEIYTGPVNLNGHTYLYSLIHDITERQEAEKALKESESKLKGFTSAMPDLGVILDSRGVYLSIFGTPEREDFHPERHWLGKQIMDVLPSDVAKKIMMAISRALETGKHQTIEYQLSMPSSLVTFEGSLAPLESPGEDPVSVAFITRDITQRRHQEEELRLAATLFDTSQAMLIADPQTNIIRVNHGFSKLLGYSNQDVQGKTPYFFISDLHDPTFYQQINEQIKQQGSWQGVIVRKKKSGEHVSCSEHISTVQNIQGETTHLIATFTDITEQERTAQQHEQERQLLNTIMDSISDGIMTCDKDGNLTLYNEATRQSHGLPKEPQPPEQWAAYFSLFKTDGITPLPIDENPLYVALREGEVLNQEMVVNPRHGEPRTLVANGKAMYDSAANVLGAVVSMHDITQRKETEKQVHRMAFYDPLTELPNRRLLLDRLKQSLAMGQRHKGFGVLMFMDLDNFKNINDGLGHAAGDQLLRQMAQRLVNSVRDEDTVARLGGDEFVVMLSMIGENKRDAMEVARSMAEKLIGVISQPIEIKSHELRITGSIGITIFPEDDQSALDLVQQADTAMYRSKNAGKNTFFFFQSSMQQAVDDRLELEKALHSALEMEQFELVIQPQIDSKDMIAAAEVLLRWRHPEKGLISPVLFIPLAEEIGLIYDIGIWVLNGACTLLNEWEQAGLLHNHFRLAVNVSPMEFQHPEYIHQLEMLLINSGANAHHLSLELTEGMLIKDVEDTIQQMARLGKLGISFSIDDFGTGYSSLAYLKRLPLDQIKIGQAFVQDITTDASDALIVETIIAMSKHLQLEVVAEGVETIHEYDFLQEKGCDLYQGYYFSRPCTPEQFLELLKSGTCAPENNP